jgi:hypothetical protein
VGTFIDVNSLNVLDAASTLKRSPDQERALNENEASV